MTSCKKHIRLKHSKKNRLCSVLNKMNHDPHSSPSILHHSFILYLLSLIFSLTIVLRSSFFLLMTRKHALLACFRQLQFVSIQVNNHHIFLLLIFNCISGRTVQRFIINKKSCEDIISTALCQSYKKGSEAHCCNIAPLILLIQINQSTGDKVPILLLITK